MKARWRVLLVVLVSNAITAWVAWTLTLKNGFSERAVLAPAAGWVGDSPSNTDSSTVTNGSPPEMMTAKGAGQSFGWQQVESDDYRQYVANLRAIGCPEETIRDIVAADVGKLFATRAKVLRDAATNRPAYWRLVAMGFTGVPDEAMLARQQQLAAEKRAVLKELLGPEVPERPESAAGFSVFDDIEGFLPADKQTAVTEVERRLATRQANAMSRSDVGALRQAYAQRDSELGQVLTPDEKLEYDLRTSATAQFLRMQTGGFEFSEQEFRAVFKLQKEFDDQFGLPRMRSNDPQEIARRNAAQRVLDGQIRNVLGEDRYGQLLAAMNRRRGLMHGVSH